MITVTDTNSNQKATIPPYDFAATVTPWFEDAPDETLETINEVADQLARGEFITGSAVSSLGLEIAAAEPMTAAEFRSLREYLGLTTAWLSKHLRGPNGTPPNERTVQRWENGVNEIPDVVHAQMLKMEADTKKAVEAGVEQAERNGGPVVIYRTDTEYHAHFGDVEWPASWNRAVARRVVEKVTGLQIVFSSDLE